MSRIINLILEKAIKPYILHLSFWIIFISYEITISQTILSQYKNLWYYFGFYILNISFFYINAKIVLSGSINNLKLWKIQLFLLTELTAYCLLSILLVNLINKNEIPLFKYSLRSFKGMLWQAIYFLIYSSTYHFLLEHLRISRQQQVELKKLKYNFLQTKNDLLRAQINPHIIFNTLSYVKFTFKSRPNNAEEAILRLSSIMRFALQDNIGEIVPLKRELEQIDNIIILNQLRFDNRIQLEYLKEIEDENVNVISLCIVSLAENIFKHGSLFNKQFPIKISIKCDSKTFQFQSSNLSGDYISKDSNNTGLRNIGSRLLSIYGNDHEFKYGIVNDLYCVDLKIKIKN